MVASTVNNISKFLKRIDIESHAISWCTCFSPSRRLIQFKIRSVLKNAFPKYENTLWRLDPFKENDVWISLPADFIINKGVYA